MILKPEIAKEIGEALVDAAQRTEEDTTDHYVIHLDELNKAVCLPADPDIEKYEYNIVAHVTKT